MKKFLMCLGILGILGAGAYGISWWLDMRYDYPDDAGVLFMEKGDIDGDGKDETISLAIEERKDGDDRVFLRIIKWTKDGNKTLYVSPNPLDIPEIEVRDCDGDNKDEIVYIVTKEEENISGKKVARGYVVVLGWDGTSVKEEAKSNDLFGFTNEKYPMGILCGLAISDVNNDGKKEIVVGVTRPHQENMEETDTNLEDNTNLQNEIVDPLVLASVITLSGTNCAKLDEKQIGSGVVYSLTDGELDNSQEDEIVADIFDLNYSNVNKFTYDVLNFMDACNNLYPEKAVKLLVKRMERNEDLAKLLTSIGPIKYTKLYKGIKEKVEKKVEKEGKKILSNIAGIGAFDYEEREEKPLPDIPTIPGPLFGSRIAVLKWQGQGFSQNTSTVIGMLNMNTKIGNNRIIIKPLDLDYNNINSYINTLNNRNSLLFVKKYERSDFINEWKGTWSWKSDDKYPEPKEIPPIPGRFLSANLQAFDISANRLWSTPAFGPFNPNITLTGDGIVNAVVDIDIPKVNQIIAHLDAELKKWRENRSDFEMKIPTIPEGIIYGKIEKYNYNGTRFWSSPPLGLLVFGLDSLNSQIALSRTTFDYEPLNNFIKEENSYIEGYMERMRKWREKYWLPYFKKRCEYIAHSNVRALAQYYHNQGISSPWGWITPHWGEDINGDGSITTYNLKGVYPFGPNGQVFEEYGYKVIIDKVNENLNNDDDVYDSTEWPSYPWQTGPDWEGPDFDRGGDLFSGELLLFEGNNQVWQSHRLGELSAQVAVQDKAAASQKIAVVGYNFPDTSIFLFTPSAPGSSSIYGRVTTHYDEPLSDALITLSNQSGKIGTTTSGKNGMYQFPGLNPGTYTLLANKDGYSPQTKTITLSAGETARVDFKLILTSATISGAVYTWGNVGPIPLPGATVTAMYKDSVVASTITSGSGAYKITGLKLGLYKISAEKDGYGKVSHTIWVEGNLEGINFYLSQGGRIEGIVYDSKGKAVEGAVVGAMGWGYYGTTTSVSGGTYTFKDIPQGKYDIFAEKRGSGTAWVYGAWVSENKTTYIDLYLKPAGGIIGKVANIASLPNKRDYTVVAFLDLKCNIDNIREVIKEGPVDFAKIEDNGSFKFNLPEGIYDLYFYEAVGDDGKNKASAAIKKAIKAQGDEEIYITILKAVYNVPAKEDSINDIGTVTLTLGTSSIQGMVKTQDGGHLFLSEDEWSLCGLINERGELISFSHIIPSSGLSDKGRYKMADLKEGKYLLIAIAPGYLPYFEMIELNGAITRDITLLKEGGKIKGNVSANGASQIANVRIKGSGIDRSKITTKDGDYEFSGLLPGPYYVSCEAQGYKLEEKRVEIKGAETLIVNFDLTPKEKLCSISGNVKKGVEPFAGVAVIAFSDKGKEGFCLTDRSGTYTISNLEKGTYSVIALAEGFEVPKPVIVVLNPGEERIVNFVLKKGKLGFNFGIVPIDNGVIIGVKASEKLSSELYYEFRKDGTILIGSGSLTSVAENKYFLTFLKSQLPKNIVMVTLKIAGTGTTSGYGEAEFVFGLDTTEVREEFPGVAGGSANILDAYQGTETGIVDRSKVEVPAGQIEGTQTVTLVIAKKKTDKPEENLASEIYEVEIGATLKDKGKIILTLSYDPTKVKNPALLAVYRKVDNQWVKTGQIIEINLIEHTVKVELTKADLGIKGISTLQKEGGEFGVFQEGAEITISPTSGYLGTIVTVKGTGFNSEGENVRIDFGTTNSITTINAPDGSFTTTFTVNQQTPGTIKVTATGLTSGKKASADFYYTPKSSIISISPRFGTNTGTISTTISGLNFFGTPTVKLANIQGTVTNVTGSTTIDAIFNLANASCGLYDLSVTNPDNQSDTLRDAFYVFAPPGTYTKGSFSTQSIGTSGGTVALPDGTKLELPQGALTSTQTVTISYITGPSLPSGFKWLGKIIFLEPHGLYLEKPGTLTIPITQADMNEIGANSINGLVVYINYGGNNFRQVPEADIIREAGTLTIKVRHFSFYCVGASGFARDNNNAKVYPNPYKKGDSKFGGPGVYFENISAGCTIKIYNIAGELVDEIVNPSTGKVLWDVTNIAPGVYIYTVTGGGGGKSVGKIGIVK